VETSRQRAARERIEGVIGLAAPVLDLVLSVGERISRALAPADEYYPIRPPEESLELSESEAPLAGVAAASPSDGAEDDA
jgi:hypothetical protein